MKKSLFLLILAALFSQMSFAIPLSGPYNIPGTLPTGYPTIKAAIADLNALGVSGSVTFNVAAGYTETFTSLTDGLVTTTTGSLASPIVFQKSGTGANPVITGYTPAPSGSDYIICIAGTDYITFNGIDVSEPTGAVEWGYAVLKGSATNGSQNVTIKNCNITLNKATTATVGIYSNNFTPYDLYTQLTITDIAGTNSNNKFYGNTITNCYSGILVYGYNDVTGPDYVYYDQNNEIGKDGANVITNFGGASAACYGIYTYYQNGLKIANNNISSAVAGSAACAGIELFTANNASVDLYSNTISIQFTPTVGTVAFYGIYNNMGTTCTNNTLNMYGNIITNCTYPSATSGGCNYIYSVPSAVTYNCYNNQVTNNTYGSASTTSTGTYYGIWYSGTPSTQGYISFYGNTISGNVRLQSIVGGGPTYYMYIAGGGTAILCNVNNNTIDNNTATTNGGAYGIYFLNGATVKNLYNNTVTGILNSRNTIYGIFTGNGYTTNIYNNKIQDLNIISTAGTVYGLALSSSTYNGIMQVYNNMIGDLKASSATSANALFGIQVSAANTDYIRLYYNTVYLSGTSSGTGFGSSAINVSTNPKMVDMRNNIFINKTTPTGTGLAVALRLGSTALTQFPSITNNNNYYAGTPGSSNPIFYDGTNKDLTLSAYKFRVWPRESQSVTENTPFMNVATTPYNLHVNPAIASQCESAGQVITTPLAITADIDNNPRFPGTGYPNNPSYPAIAPDLGADEFGGIPSDVTGPTITYSPLLNTASLTARTLTATITDIHGVPTSGTGLPRLAWKKLYNGTWNYETGVSAGSDQYTFSFGSGAAVTDTVYYYVIAQDNFSTPAVASYPFSGANGYTTSPPACSTPPTTPYKYIFIQGICGTFNVGSGQAYATLTAAINDIKNKELTCPVTLLLTDNTYSSETYPIVIPQLAGSSSTNTLTIKPAPGATPVFATSYLGVTPNYFSQITLNGAQYIIIDGSNSGGSDRSMTFKNTATGGFAAAIGLYNNGTIGAGNIIIKNCVIQAHTELTYNAQGIVLYTLSGNAGFNNVIINNNTINSAKFGVQVAGIAANPATNIQVTNNTIGDMLNVNAVTQNIITTNYVDNVLIENNNIIGTAEGMAFPAVSPMGLFLYGGSNNVKIRKNKIHDIYNTTAGASSLAIYAENEGETTTEISDNLIYNIKGAGTNTSPQGGNPMGIYVYIGGNMKIYHNTIYMSGACLSATAATMSACIGLGNNLVSMDVRDNILKNSMQPISGTPASFSYCITTGSGTPFTNINNNDYFVDGIGPIIGYTNGKNRVNFANWQGATLQDLNSVNIDPVFSSSTNLIPTTAAMPHAGVYIPMVPNDITYANRTNPPDIGAYEFTVDPLVTTMASSGVTYNGATLNGSGNANNFILNMFFDWGLTASYGNTIVASPATLTGNSLTSENAAITGLGALTTYHYRARGVTSTGLIVYGSDMTFTTAILPTKTLNLSSVFLEGLYNGLSTMFEAKDVTRDEFGNVTGVYEKWGVGVADQITVELHASTTHYDAVCNCQVSDYPTVIYPATGVSLSTTGTATVSVPGVYNGTYYLTIKQRNHIETVSALPLSFSGATINYAFDAATQALDANMTTVLEADGETVSPPLIFGGDINQDGQVEAEDMNEVGNDASSFVYGYVPSDVVADAQVESADINITGNNAAAFVYTHRPM